MKIIFICGSLEPGRDGVGDYTRNLSGELIRQGHNCGIISLKDKAVTQESKSIQFDGTISIPVLRIPAIVKANEKILLIKKWICDFNPDWVSLQYVPFSFHPKGIHFGLVHLLKELGPGRKWHIMFHELWVGMEKDASFKKKIWGKLQQILIKTLVNGIKPYQIHTQSHIYLEQLHKLKYNAELLPLFSNIKNNLPYNRDWDKRNFLDKKKISFVIFGTIHYGGQIHEFIQEIASYCKKEKITVNLIMVGSCGKEQDTWSKLWISEALQVEILGELLEECISKVLNSATFGITTTPVALIEKSGTVAAMQEHHLPVICVSRSWQPKGIKNIHIPPGVMIYKKGNLSSLLNNKPTISINSVTQVSKKLTKTLLNIL